MQCDVGEGTEGLENEPGAVSNTVIVFACLRGGKWNAVVLYTLFTVYH